MHILGGLGVAALTASLLAYNGVKVSFWKLFVAYIVVAIIWEAYEYIHDMLLGRVWNGWFDTIKDTIDGFIGMSVLYLFAKR
ncbi:MAG: hypothetical protein JWN37_33 [Candidatus Nomurabacteria bacterium]|nr:hypothetical protein [Candidatus Nomurabacteria bacterium]